MSLSKEAKAAFASLMSEPVLKGFDTKSKKQHREEFDKSYGKTTSTSDIASKIEQAQQAVWQARAYALLVRHSTCKGCGRHDVCLESPRLYLELHRIPKDASNPIRYQAVREIEFHQLPRRKVISVATTPFCLECFECPTSSPSSSTDSSSSVLEDIQSLIDELGDSPLASAQAGSGEEDSSSSSHSISQSTTTEVAFAGYPSEKEYGLGSESESKEIPARAEG